MPLDSAGADQQLDADLVVREAAASEPRDLALLRSYIVVRLNGATRWRPSRTSWPGDETHRPLTAPPAPEPGATITAAHYAHSGRPWSRVLWRCWQTRTPYDPRTPHRPATAHQRTIPAPFRLLRPNLAATQRMAGAAVTQRAARRTTSAQRLQAAWRPAARDQRRHRTSFAAGRYLCNCGWQEQPPARRRLVRVAQRDKVDTDELRARNALQTSYAGSSTACVHARVVATAGRGGRPFRADRGSASEIARVTHAVGLPEGAVVLSRRTPTGWASASLWQGR